MPAATISGAKTALDYLARLSEDERKAILGGTATAFYRL